MEKRPFITVIEYKTMFVIVRTTGVPTMITHDPTTRLFLVLWWRLWRRIRDHTELFAKLASLDGRGDKR